MWTPDEREGFTYDALDRLVGGSPVSGAQGYTVTYGYDPTGNITYATGVGTYVYTVTVSGCATGTVSAKPHAVGRAGGNTYVYDCNGNATRRVISGTPPITYYQEYDAENRLVAVTNTVTSLVTRFAYDGDGQRVKVTAGTTTTVYIGDYYEKQGSTVTRYYYLGGQRVAMRVGPAGQAGTLSYLHGDHLGSTSLATSSSGGVVARQRYYPYGAVRPGGTGTLPTDYTFTGQWSGGDVRLIHMGARWYDPQIGRWMSADTIVPDPANPQSLNRYSYVLGNPLKFSDPTGHIEACGAYGQSCNESPPPPSPIDTLDEVEEWLLATMFDNSHSDVVNEMYRDLGSSDTRTVIRAYQLWIEQVKTEGPWDFKRYVHRRWKGGVWLADCGWWSYETVANIHYGYVGMAAGFMDVELLGGAGAAQVKDHFLDLLLAGESPDWGAIGTLQTYFDDPEDQAAIRIGIDLYNQRENVYQPITHAEFKAAFRPYASQLKPGPAPTWLREIMGLKVSD